MPIPQDALHDEADVPTPEQEYLNALRYHGGDASATVRTLLQDCKHLREQLALTQIAMSAGFTRGWLPSFERELKGE